ncbi:MAG: hypothetical protein BWX60_00403 [Candidatus Marinimicrobia bacterium ADurb.Bin030]|nr:MAG: hypothetical protein BWX60_00403 [Candidatus Marinimicrobia bacterium ADurb.Bin030]
MGIITRVTESSVIVFGASRLGRDVDQSRTEIAVFGIITTRKQRDLFDSAQRDTAFGIAGGGIDIG